MVSLARGTRRLALSLKSGAKIFNTRNVRHSSQAAAKCKIVEGNNGEKIFTSPYSDVDLPSVTVPEYVWENVEQWSNNIALECGITGRKYTYAQTRDAANYVARSLRNLGLKEGEVVAVILPNLPESAISFLGILEAGIIATTVNPFYTVDEITKQLVDSGAKAVITSGDIAPSVLAAVRSCMPPDAPKIIVDDGQVPDGTIPFKDLITRGKNLPPLPTKRQSPDELATLPYSSGTTGLPKGVELTHRNLVADMVMVTGSLDPRTFENCTKDVIPAFLPLFHIYGMNVLMLPRLARGSRLVTLPRFTPESFVSVLDKHQCTQLFCVPPIVLFFAASPLVKKKHLQTVRAIFSGAAPLAESDIERVYKKFGVTDENLRFLQGYGMTECSAVSFVESSNSKYASIGHPICNSEARLVDLATNRDVSTPGQCGELWLRGPHIMRAYRNNVEATSDAIDDGWLKTGDIAYFDDERDFFITDRLKELVKVKGFQVPPAELEAILRTHPDIEEAAVIGIPDVRSGEVPKAFVLRRKGGNLSEEDVQNFIKGKVAEYKELKGGVTFVDTIPKNPSGKILRMKLKEFSNDNEQNGHIVGSQHHRGAKLHSCFPEAKATVQVDRPFAETKNISSTGTSSGRGARKKSEEFKTDKDVNVLSGQEPNRSEGRLDEITNTWRDVKRALSLLCVKTFSPKAAMLEAPPGSREDLVEAARTPCTPTDLDTMLYGYTNSIYVLDHTPESLPDMDMLQLFASPAGRALVTGDNRSTTRGGSTSTSLSRESSSRAKNTRRTSSTVSLPTPPPRQRKSSAELYKEAVEILGLTCSLTDSCRCIDCQSNYFDCDDDCGDARTELAAGTPILLDHALSHPLTCSIQ